MFTRQETPKELSRLFKELGAIDQKRKEILTKIKSHPEHMRKYVEDFFKTAIAKEDWYIRRDYNGNALELERTECIMKLVSGEITYVEKGMATAKVKFMTLSGGTATNTVNISIKGDVGAQVFQNLLLLEGTELRKIKKEIEAFQKKKEIFAKRQELQNQINALQKELEKLK